MKIDEVFARRRCWACLWFVCFSRSDFDIVRHVFQGQGANLQPPRYPALLEHTKLLAHSAPEPIIEEPTQFPAPETVPGIFAWFLKAIS